MSADLDMVVNTPLWPRWTEIAFDHELDASDARARAEHGNELRASLIAVSASAHALDALYGIIKAQLKTAGAVVPRPDSRHSAVREALKLGFRFRGNPSRLDIEFEWLFDLRDSAVHYEENPGEPQPHPSGGRTGAAGAGFRLEDARRAVDLVVEILGICASAPKPPLQPWTSQYEASIKTILAERRVRQART